MEPGTRVPDKAHLSYLTPLWYPRAIGDRIVTKQRGRFLAHQLPDLAEYQPDLFFGAQIRPGLDGVPQRPDIGCPDNPGAHSLGGKHSHKRRLVLFLMHLDALFVQPKVVRHQELKFLELLQQRAGPLHQLIVGPRPVRKPEGYVLQPDEAQRLLRNRRTRPVPDELVSRYPADIVQHEREAGVLQYRAVGHRQDVLQVLDLVGADPLHVRVQAGFPGPVAHLAGELGQVLRVVVQLAAIQPLQPALPPDFAQVGSDLAVVEPRLGDKEDLWLHAPHVTARYGLPGGFAAAQRPAHSCREGHYAL